MGWILSTFLLFWCLTSKLVFCCSSEECPGVETTDVMGAAWLLGMLLPSEGMVKLLSVTDVVDVASVTGMLSPFEG